MPKIVVTQPLNSGFSEDQIKRLKSLGYLRMYANLAKDVSEWLDRCHGVDIICSGKWGLKEKIYDLAANTFVSLPFVGVGWLDIEKCQKNKIFVASSPGCNKDALAETNIGFLINLLRKQYYLINNDDKDKPVKTTGLKDKRVCILGKGNIGLRTGEICEALKMKVNYFTRKSDLKEAIEKADVVINCLSLNPTTIGLLDNKFFSKLKKGSYFISATSEKIFDLEAMLEALNKGILNGAGIDAGGIQCGDSKNYYYQKLIKHPKILALPHIAYCTDVSGKICNDMMIDNIEAWIKGKPINIVT